MLNTTKNFLLQDKNKINDFHIVFDPSLSIMRVYIEADGKTTEAFIDKDEFWTVAFSIADERTQEMLIPVRTEQSRVFEKQIRVRAQKDIKKGEEIIVSHKMTIPIETLVQASSTKGGIVVPR